MNYIDCWISVASALFSQALAGGPALIEKEPEAAPSERFAFAATLTGSVIGSFSVSLDSDVLSKPLLGEGTDQKQAWGELLREAAGAAAGELRARTGQECDLQAFAETSADLRGTRSFSLRTSSGDWAIVVADQTRRAPTGAESESARSDGRVPEASSRAGELSPGVELLQDVELHATLRFGCREMRLGELLALGPGDVVELDRQVADPVDLVVGDKIVARGEVVLVNGNFGLRVTEVAAPRKRLESIRCLF